MIKKFGFTLVLLYVFGVSAQTLPHPKIKGWHLLDIQHDGYYGIGAQQAYDLLKNRKSTTITIAVIDSGIDTAQEDLTAALWVNKKEIAGNGKDDDGNGYIDDVHGWNFCGAPGGENLKVNSHEVERVYFKWKNEFENKEEKDISADKKFLFGQWQKAKGILSTQYKEYEQNYPNVENNVNTLQLTANLLSNYIGKASFKRSEIPFTEHKDSTGWAALIWESIFNQTTDTTVTDVVVLQQISDYKNTLLSYKKKMEEPPVDFRGGLIKDNYLDINDSIYGNNNLTAGSGNHGTHVSGIIGAIRNNGIGVDGIVSNVRIMAVRAVPGGDEHDKDVAEAIRYAVDNGAQIINMSFGKPVSPYKKMVDDAVRYAAARNVLIVHGSGNDGEDINENTFYPSPVFLDGTSAVNMLTIGASGDYSTGGLIASFSNYGNKVVDIFAPGVYINSTISNNGYEAYDGTSMASPVAAGAAGLIKSYFPKLTPQQIIDLIMRSGTVVKDEVIVPGTDKKTTLDKLCKSGKIINVYEAVKLALQLYGK